MTDPQVEPAEPRRPLVALAELMRLPNLFTAAADPAMGFLFVRPYVSADNGLIALLLGASASLYAGGVVLNDVCDHRLDAVERPERPIPSGRIGLGMAAALACVLLALGVALAWTAALLAGTVRPGLVALVLAVTIVAYDTFLKRTPLGPLAMGACRMGNVLLGMSVLDGPWQTIHWFVAGAMGVYITGVTWFARHEADKSRPAQLALATVVLMSGVGMLGTLPAWPIRWTALLLVEPNRWHLMIGMLAALIGWRCLWAVLDPTPELVRAAVRQCILSVVVLDAAAAFAMRGLPGAAAICMLLAPALVLQQWLDST